MIAASGSSMTSQARRSKYIQYTDTYRWVLENTTIYMFQYTSCRDY